jgi:hypothetical protein
MLVRPFSFGLEFAPTFAPTKRTALAGTKRNFPRGETVPESVLRLWRFAWSHTIYALFGDGEQSVKGAAERSTASLPPEASAWGDRLGLTVLNRNTPDTHQKCKEPVAMTGFLFDVWYREGFEPATNG